MINFVWFWIFLALPLPFLVQRFMPKSADTGEAALLVPFLEDLEGLPDTERATTPASNRSRFWIALVAWVLLVSAAARPEWLGEPVEQAVTGRDLMLAVDLSGSMDIRDFILEGEQVDRLSATQWVAGQFIERRVGDRLGLILFGDHAYLQSPLTFDRRTVHTLLDEAVIGLAGDKTAIGEAIGLAVKRLKDNPAGQRVLILLSDGANTAGTVSPLQAADLAAETGLKVYTIGIGADQMQIRDFFGNRSVNPSQDLDEPTMRGIAEKTGGQYFRARDTEELENIYKILDQLEPVERDKRFYRPRTELYPWPLGAALLLASGLILSRGQSIQFRKQLTP
jgi:Ca-activated chloride channel family protein